MLAGRRLRTKHVSFSRDRPSHLSVRRGNFEKATMTRKSYHLLENTVKLDMGLKPLELKGKATGVVIKTELRAGEVVPLAKRSPYE